MCVCAVLSLLICFLQDGVNATFDPVAPAAALSNGDVAGESVASTNKCRSIAQQTDKAQCVPCLLALLINLILA